MNNFANWMDQKLSGPMARLAEQRHLQAIRDGVISALPFIIIGSFFLIIASPPLPQNWGITEWASNNAADILIPYRLTMFIMSLYVAFGIGYNLSRSYGIDALSGAQIAVAALLLTITPQVINETEYVLPMEPLGPAGLFVAMLCSIFAVEVMRLCKEKNVTIKMPPQVPTSVSRSFEALIPVAIVIVSISIVTLLIGLDIHHLVEQAVAPIVAVGDSFVGVIIPVFLITFFWSFGIHGVSIVGTIARPFWEVYLVENSAAVADGSNNLPHVAPETFFQWFIWIGGAGSTLGLIIVMLLFAKSKYSKTLGRTTAVPGLFNINEPIIFGAPIVLNPILIIPFVSIPLILATLSYIATVLGLVSETYVMPPWTLPAPIGAYLATGGDWRAIVLVFVNIFLSCVIYYPFFKIYDNQLLQQEKTEEDEETDSDKKQKERTS